MSGTDQNRTHARARSGVCRRWSGRLPWCVLGAVLLVGLAPLSGRATPPAAAVHPAAVTIGGPFELVDQYGVRRTDADFRGSYLLMYFGFTYCPDTCPTTLLKITQALEQLTALDAARAERVVPVFISVDPERDTPEVLQSYALNFHPRLVALTGSQRELERMGRAYGVFFAKVPTGSGDYLMDHTGFVYLIGPDGKYVEHFESDVSVDELIGALRRELTVAAADR